ncbi:hypothetical protein TBLA_0B01090 [Henningerozyma blattae CBS 6284]|uniref:Sm domain-containing protein n=1 Tax=Henningerozyma blattae (strain ATCC 34711 / CBS 6284 / DSM 70876 / NBRC 10599 / NRRL Y-10934 / UCD 77-7) TaxID=1071380 RepID=I2GXV0_HENB6|nr:hypothetical protein TBLA_0B01090 [Tetrapisispora blattae CBS 6284]CCH58952.1 hypothetical protein TBLA_0B01090 [Tetrapisispora blattae CBS 6284]
MKPQSQSSADSTKDSISNDSQPQSQQESHSTHHQSQQHHQSNKKKFEVPRREAIVDLSKYKDSKVRVKLMGGRLVIGILKGYDQLMNLVLDETIEYIRDPTDPYVIQKDKTRNLGLAVIRGNVLLTLSPVDGSEIIYMQTSD